MIGSSATCAFLFPEGALPSEASDGEECVYLAVKLSPEILRTSDLLEGISGTSGYAKLPCGISDEDVLLWRSSSPDQAVPPLPKLQRIVKVAEALSDTRMQQWAALLAFEAANTPWTSSYGSEDMHDMLLSLSTNARTAVLENLLDSMSPSKALLTLPATLHPHLVAAMLDPSGSLSHPPDPLATPPFMVALPSLAHSAAPPLRSLDCSAAAVQPSSCHLLTDVLTHSTALSSLMLGLPDIPPRATRVLHALLPPLARASGLLRLEICSPGRKATVSLDAVDALTDGLASLPHLEALLLLDVDCAVTPSEAPPDLASSARAHAAALRRQMARLLAAVAAHPHVAELQLECVHMHAALPWPAAFPVLRDLEVTCWLADPAGKPWLAGLAQAQRTADAPHAVHFPALTRLQFALSADDGRALQTEVARAVQAAMHPFWLPIGAGLGPELCPELQTLGIDVGNFRLPLGALAERSIWTSLAGAISATPYLRDLHLEAVDVRTAAGSATDHLRRLPLLSSLKLSHGHMPNSDIIPWGFADTLPLSLQSLCLGAHYDPDGEFARQLLERLRRASQLTALLLQSGFTDAAAAPVLRGGVYGEGLPSLVALRTVRLEGWRITEADALWRGLAGLPALRSLYIHYVQVKVTNEHVFLSLPEALLSSHASFTEAVAAMPRLRVLDLYGYADAATVQLLQLLATALAERRRPAAPPLEIVHGIAASLLNAGWMHALTLALDRTNIRISACAGAQNHGEGILIE